MNINKALKPKYMDKYNNDTYEVNIDLMNGYIYGEHRNEDLHDDKNYGNGYGSLYNYDNTGFYIAGDEVILYGDYDVFNDVYCGSKWDSFK